VGTHADGHGNAGGAQALQTLAAHQGVGVTKRNDHPSYACLNQRIDTGRRAAVMAAGLQCDVDRGALNIMALARCVAQRNDLRVRPTCLRGSSLAQNRVVANDDATDSRIGRSDVERGVRQLQREPHPARIDVNRGGHSGLPGDSNSLIAFMNSSTSSKLRYTDAKRTYATLSSSRSSAMTRSPMKREVTSFWPLCSSLSQMRSMADSVCSVLTGRLRSASFRLACNLAISKSVRVPLRFTPAGMSTSARSKVVKRLSHAGQRLRRRMTSPSSCTRVSITWVSGRLQKGHFMACESAK